MLLTTRKVNKKIRLSKSITPKKAIHNYQQPAALQS